MESLLRGHPNEKRKTFQLSPDAAVPNSSNYANNIKLTSAKEKPINNGAGNLGRR